ncbi:MAG: FAD-dependent oxidoreductase [Methylophilaceae bacterium]
MKTDIAIVGAGLVGLAAAIALEKAGYDVIIIDAKDPSKDIVNLENEAWDKRIYAISPANVAWLEKLGVWQLLDSQRVGPMRAMEIWGDDTAQALMLTAEDVNADTLGLIIEGRALLQALLKRINDLSIQTLFEKTCSSLVTSRKGTGNTLHLDSGESIEFTVLLAADGVNSWVRQQMDMPYQQKSYHQLGIVANFEVSNPHANIARQWFAKDADNKNSILAWLPLPENKISIVWSVSNEHGQYLLQLPKSEFTQEVAKAGFHCLGDLELITAPASFPLTMLKTASLVQECVVFIGDAAHQVHPMAGQGMNLGFRDVIDFVDALERKHTLQAINDHYLLRTYERKRKEDMAKMLLLTDGLFKLFESQSPVVKNVRNQGLLLTNSLPIKKLLVSNAISL